MQKKNFAEAVANQFSGLKVTVDDVKSVVLRHNFNTENVSKWTDEELARFARELRRDTKPMVIAANKIDTPKGPENYEKVKEEFDYPMVPCFADGELALREADRAGLIEYIPGEKSFEVKKPLTDKQKAALGNINKIMDRFGSTGVQEVLNKMVLDILKYIAIYPAGDKLADSKGNILPDCYLMKKGSTALDFAFRLHSDIGKNFVKAIDVRTKRAVGKDYELKHMDGFEIITK
jgi:ribosome-binding ATPase YchF (GTP1/OBG family)